MAKKKEKKKQFKPNIVSGGLSTAEKRASLNPAIREEGQREAAALSPDQRKATRTKAQSITRRGFAGTAKAEQVTPVTQQQVATAQQQARQQPLFQQPFQQAQQPLTPQTPISPQTAPPVVNADVLNQDLIQGGLISQQEQGAVPVPEDFARDVAIGTAAGVGAIAAGTLALGVAAGAGTEILATSGITGIGTLKAASGKLTSSIITERIKLGGGRVLVNTYTAGKTASYLSKLVSTLKSPFIIAPTVLGILGTGLYTSFFWAPNEKGDAMTTLGIAQGAAAREKDWEMVKKIGDQMRAANDISAEVPAIGFIQAEKAKFKASMAASEVYSRQADLALAGAETNETRFNEAENHFKKRQAKWKSNDDIVHQANLARARRENVTAEEIFGQPPR